MDLPKHKESLEEILFVVFFFTYLIFCFFLLNTAPDASQSPGVRIILKKPITPALITSNAAIVALRLCGIALISAGTSMNNKIFHYFSIYLRSDFKHDRNKNRNSVVQLTS